MFCFVVGNLEINLDIANYFVGSCDTSHWTVFLWWTCLSPAWQVCHICLLLYLAFTVLHVYFHSWINIDFAYIEKVWCHAWQRYYNQTPLSCPSFSRQPCQSPMKGPEQIFSHVIYLFKLPSSFVDFVKFETWQMCFYPHNLPRSLPANVSVNDWCRYSLSLPNSSIADDSNEEMYNDGDVENGDWYDEPP